MTFPFMETCRNLKTHNSDRFVWDVKWKKKIWNIELFVFRKIASLTGTFSNHFVFSLNLQSRIWKHFNIVFQACSGCHFNKLLSWNYAILCSFLFSLWWLWKFESFLKNCSSLKEYYPKATRSLLSRKCFDLCCVVFFTFWYIMCLTVWVSH